MVFALSVAGLLSYGIYCLWQNASTRNTQKELQDIREEADTSPQYEMQFDENGLPVAGVAAVLADIYKDIEAGEENSEAPKILPKYKELYALNPDLIGWLSIDGTVIDYPVMQTMEDECYYLRLDFYGKPNQNGCLILDTDSLAGTGTKTCDYANGTAPSTNLIIHGHTMKSGEMFGNLNLYADAEYGAGHHIIRFDSLYEEREYELIAVFYSQVYYERDTVFKYYKFFQADTQEEFDDWYENIKAMSLYDTGVTAQFGDEFLTLSCCSYHVEDGRFVVVGKRVN
ncbi:MAG: class B sortase [Clostridiales bacterium]|nr:class B sortase [Clostridiales bacterium]